mgnify:CR=1 FL=1
MESEGFSHHISRRFNAELEHLRSEVLRMGGLVEQHLDTAVEAITSGDSEMGLRVSSDDFKINRLEVSIDEECSKLLATRMPGLQAQLFRLLSEDIGKASLLAGDFSADERMAAFLVALSRRFARRGFSPSRLHLTMTRTDIANYLRLAPETVSRVLKRMQDDKLIGVERRELEILDVARLEALALNVLRN